MNRCHFTVVESTSGGQLFTATDTDFVCFLLFFGKSWGRYLNLKKYTFCLRIVYRFRTVNTVSKSNWNLACKDLTIAGFFAF